MKKALVIGITGQDGVYLSDFLVFFLDEQIVKSKVGLPF